MLRQVRLMGTLVVFDRTWSGLIGRLCPPFYGGFPKLLLPVKFADHRLVKGLVPLRSLRAHPLALER
jgi:hypothetical protein